MGKLKKAFRIVKNDVESMAECRCITGCNNDCTTYASWTGVESYTLKGIEYEKLNNTS